MTADAPDPVTRDDLLSALKATCEEVSGYFSDLDPRAFMTSASGRWSPAQHLDHLNRSNAPVAAGLSLARSPLTRLAARLGLARGLLTPAPRGRARLSYANLLTHYRAALAAGARASGRYLPEVRGTPAGQIGEYRATLYTLGTQLRRWSDADLDRWLVRHPVLGELSLRELLYFTQFHNQHHLDGVRVMQRDLPTSVRMGAP